ncbi:MAG TPA: hypothetical protein VN626_09920 [Clostridia bacterium]|nr:hypothetical protein [Clostridia bacterium]
MTRYSVLLSEELEAAYKNVSAHLDISMEQALTGALQLFIERMTLERYPGLADDSKLRKMTINSEVTCK